MGERGRSACAGRLRHGHGRAAADGAGWKTRRCRGEWNNRRTFFVVVVDRDSSRVVVCLMRGQQEKFSQVGRKGEVEPCFSLCSASLGLNSFFFTNKQKTK
jgi:hypothetical protein